MSLLPYTPTVSQGSARGGGAPTLGKFCILLFAYACVGRNEIIDLRGDSRGTGGGGQGEKPRAFRRCARVSGFLPRQHIILHGVFYPLADYNSHRISSHSRFAKYPPPPRLNNLHKIIKKESRINGARARAIRVYDRVCGLLYCVLYLRDKLACKRS